MRSRNKRINVHFTEAELAALDRKVQQAQMSRQEYIRTIINNKTPVAIPPKDYFRLAKEMRAAGNTMNRIAAQLFSTKMFDAAAYQRTAVKVLKTSDEMHMALTPRKDK